MKSYEITYGHWDTGRIVRIVVGTNEKEWDEPSTLLVSRKFNSRHGMFTNEELGTITQWL